MRTWYLNAMRMKPAWVFFLVIGCKLTSDPPAGTDSDPVIDSEPDDSATDDSATDDSATDDSAADDSGEVDADGDGYTEEEDCDDQDADVHPGAWERCDGVDADCDGVVDGGLCGDSSLADHVRVSGRAAGDYAAYPSLGDLDGDGYDEVIVGAYGADSDNLTDNGAAYVFYGPVRANTAVSAADWVLRGADNGDHLGAPGAALGDITGDGLDDLLVGAGRSGPNVEGTVYLVLGASARRSGSTSASAAFADGGPRAAYTGGATQDYLGNFSMANLGDLDGDGAPELGAAVPYADIDGEQRGVLWILNSASSTLTGGPYGAVGATVIEGVSGEAELGFALATAGDVDGDGSPDLLAASNTSLGRRVSWLVSGAELVSGQQAPVDGFALSRVTEHATLGGGLFGDRAGGGDVNDDGYADLFISDYLAYNNSGAAVGQVHVVLGSAAPTQADSVDRLASLHLVGPDEGGPSTRFGAGLAVTWDADGDGQIQDLDGDGLADLLVARESSDEGAIYVFYGADLTEAVAGGGAADAEDLAAATLTQEHPGDVPGLQMAVGDVNGDGLADVLISGTGYDLGDEANYANAGAAWLLFGGLE